MKSVERLSFIKSIASHLQENFKTREINILLSGFGIKSERINVESKRLYVQELLTTASNDTVNEIAMDLELHGSPFENPELDQLMKIDLPTDDLDNVKQKVTSAISKFRRYQSDPDDRKDAIRELVGVLEFLRPSLREVFDSKDESDLFNIANNFSIRHHRQDQKSNYDKAIWLSWMFHVYLATIHAAVRSIKKSRPKK